MDLNIILSENAITPKRTSSGAAGYDLYSKESGVLKAMSYKVFDTGVTLEIPSGFYGKIFSRSGLCAKHGIEAGAGVIDEDYRGVIKVILFNRTDKDYEVNNGDRVAQIVFMRYENFTMKKVDSLNETTRGEGGIGSTGV